MQVVAVEDREADADQRNLERLALVQRVALDELAVAVADHEVRLVGEHQRAQVPEILAGVGFAVRAEGRGLQHLFHGLVPLLAAVVAEDVDRLGAEFEQELGHTDGEVRVAVEGELLAVQPGVAVGHHVDQAAALLGERLGNRLAGDFADLHQELVGPLQSHRHVDLGHFMLPGVLDQFLGLFQLHRLEQEGGMRVRRVLHLIHRRAAGVHAELAVGWRVEHFRRVRQEAVVDVHFLHHPLNDAEVAQVGLEARHEVDLAVAALDLVRHVVEREVARDALEHVVPAGHVAADEARGVRVGDRVVLRDMAFLLRVVDEGVEVIADDLGHTGRGDRDHVRLVQRLGVFQAVEHVLLAAENGRVFRHGVGNASDRLLEVTVEVGAEVGHAALRAVHVGQRLFEAEGAQHRAERLAGLRRVDGERFALEVELLVFLGRRPLEGLFDLRLVDAGLELRLFGERILVFVLPKQGETRFDVISRLHVHLLARAANPRTRALG